MRIQCNGCVCVFCIDRCVSVCMLLIVDDVHVCVQGHLLVCVGPCLWSVARWCGQRSLLVFFFFLVFFLLFSLFVWI